MFDLFKHNKEPLHVTRETVFDDESIPAAALDGDFKGKAKVFSGLEPVSPNAGDIWYKKDDIGVRLVQWDGEQWVDTFTKNPISGSDCSKVIAGKQLKQTADKANDDRTLAKDVRRLNALLAKEAAQGNYSCEVQSDFFIANIGALIMAMAVQDIKAKVENDIVYMNWKSND